jgi:hypothetical protein
MEYSWAGEKLIHDKKPEAKNLVTLSLQVKAYEVIGSFEFG